MVNRYPENETACLARVWAETWYDLQRKKLPEKTGKNRISLPKFLKNNEQYNGYSRSTLRQHHRQY